MLNARKIPGPPSFVAARCSRVPLMASSGRIWPSLTEPTALWAPSSTHLSWRSGFGWLGDFHGVFTWVWQGLVDKIEVPKLQNTNGICNIPSHTTPPPQKTHQESNLKNLIRPVLTVATGATVATVATVAVPGALPNDVQHPGAHHPRRWPQRRHDPHDHDRHHQRRTGRHHGGHNGKHHRKREPKLGIRWIQK